MRNTFDYYDHDVYLEHHGIKGQKWGVRRFQNPDGTLTQAGIRRYRSLFGRKERSEHRNTQDKIFKFLEKNNEYDVNYPDNVFKFVGADKEHLKEARKAVAEYVKAGRKITAEVDAMFKDLRSDENLHFYEAVSELASDAAYFKKDVNKFTLSEVADAGFMGVHEDGQQSTINAYSMYASEKHLEDKVRDVCQRYDGIYKTSFEKSEEAIETGLREVGCDDMVASRHNNKYKLVRNLTSSLYGKVQWDAESGGWYAHDADHASQFSYDDKRKIDEARRYISNISNANKGRTWWCLNEAAENLGMSSTELRNMTQSDWDRLNREIARLCEKTPSWIDR